MVSPDMMGRRAPCGLDNGFPSPPRPVCLNVGRVPVLASLSQTASGSRARSWWGILIRTFLEREEIPHPCLAPDAGERRQPTGARGDCQCVGSEGRVWGGGVGQSGGDCGRGGVDWGTDI